MKRSDSKTINKTDTERDSKHLQLRKAIRQERRSLSAKQQAHAAEQLLANILQEEIYKNATTIAFYQAFDGEIDPTLALEAALNIGKRCFLPVMSQTKVALAFVEYQSESSLTKNSFGILEPKLYPNNALAPEHMDIIFMPLVAFDLNGTRLGMGKGYYDRNLAFMLEDSSEMSLKSKKTPKLIGLAHECQRVEQLERADWDVPLNQIISDQATYTITS